MSLEDAIKYVRNLPPEERKRRNLDQPITNPTRLAELLVLIRAGKRQWLKSMQDKT